MDDRQLRGFATEQAIECQSLLRQLGYDDPSGKNSFDTQLALAKKDKKISRDLISSLYKFKEIRNKLAHEPDVKLNANEVESLANRCVNGLLALVDEPKRKAAFEQAKIDAEGEKLRDKAASGKRWSKRSELDQEKRSRARRFRKARDDFIVAVILASFFVVLLLLIFWLFQYFFSDSVEPENPSMLTGYDRELYDSEQKLAVAISEQGILRSIFNDTDEVDRLQELNQSVKDKILANLRIELDSVDRKIVELEKSLDVLVDDQGVLRSIFNDTDEIDLLEDNIKVLQQQKSLLQDRIDDLD